MVKLFKQSDNGEVGILTDCANLPDFTGQLTAAIAAYNELRAADATYTDSSRDLEFILKNAFSIALVLSGHTSTPTKVTDRVFRFAGASFPTGLDVADVSV